MVVIALLQRMCLNDKMLMANMPGFDSRMRESDHKGVLLLLPNDVDSFVMESGISDTSDGAQYSPVLAHMELL